MLVISNNYAKETQVNTSELYAIFKAYGVKVGTYYSSDLKNFVGHDQDARCIYLGYINELPAQVRLEVRYGRFDYKDDVFLCSRCKARGDYHEWKAKLTRNALDIDWGGLCRYRSFQERAQEQLSYTDGCTKTSVVSASKMF
jgi:hypothetical protein